MEQCSVEPVIERHEAIAHTPFQKILISIS